MADSYIAPPLWQHDFHLADFGQSAAPAFSRWLDACNSVLLFEPPFLPHRLLPVTDVAPATSGMNPISPSPSLSLVCRADVGRTVFAEPTSPTQYHCGSLPDPVHLGLFDPNSDHLRSLQAVHQHIVKGQMSLWMEVHTLRC